MADLTSRARALLADPEARQAHLSYRVMLHMLMLEYIIEHPPAGRSATTTVVKCLRDYKDLAYDLQGALGAPKKDPGKGVLGGPGGEGWVRGKRGGIGGAG